MTRLWITGANGTVGSRLVRAALAQGDFDHICAFAHASAPIESDPRVFAATLDIGKVDDVQALAEQYPPDIIINPAAMTNVDACETRRDEAISANTAGPRNLAQVSRTHGAHLMHVSTDYVFPGDAAHPGPYREDAPTRAISHYGQTKLDGDLAIQEVCGNDVPWTIVRTALVCGSGARSNFVTWLVRELRAGKGVRIVRDQFNTPTLADDLADALLWLALEKATGIYHVAGPDRMGRHEWAQAIINRFGLDESLITWVTTAELNQPAPRPLESGLLCERYTAHYQEGAPVLRGMYEGVRTIDWGV